MGPSTRPSRRLILQGTAVAGVGVSIGGCTVSGNHDDPTSSRRPPGSPRRASDPAGSATPDVRLVERAIADEQALLLDCRRFAAAHPAIAPALRQVEDQQREHVAALRAALTDPGRAKDGVGRVGSGHGDRAAVLGKVRRLLVAAQRRRRLDALAASSGLLARLFASMSASHAVAAGLDSLQA